jgi:hypothetical protein
MALISKADLGFTDYNWTIFRGDDPRVSGAPDETVFNGSEGHEVLYLINKMAKINNFKQKFSGLKVERMLREVLPPEVQTQIDIIHWIGKNWTSYK